MQHSPAFTWDTASPSVCAHSTSAARRGRSAAGLERRRLQGPPFTSAASLRGGGAGPCLFVVAEPGSIAAAPVAQQFDRAALWLRMISSSHSSASIRSIKPPALSTQSTARRSAAQAPPRPAPGPTHPGLDPAVLVVSGQVHIRRLAACPQHGLQAPHLQALSTARHNVEAAQHGNSKAHRRGASLHEAPRHKAVHDTSGKPASGSKHSRGPPPQQEQMCTTTTSQSSIIYSAAGRWQQATGGRARIQPPCSTTSPVLRPMLRPSVPAMHIPPRCSGKKRPPPCRHPSPPRSPPQAAVQR